MAASPRRPRPWVHGRGEGIFRHSTSDFRPLILLPADRLVQHGVDQNEVVLAGLSHAQGPLHKGFTTTQGKLFAASVVDRALDSFRQPLRKRQPCAYALAPRSAAPGAVFKSSKNQERSLYYGIHRKIEKWLFGAAEFLRNSIASARIGLFSRKNSSKCAPPEFRKKRGKALSCAGRDCRGCGDGGGRAAWLACLSRSGTMSGTMYPWSCSAAQACGEVPAIPSTASRHRSRYSMPLRCGAGMW